MIPCGTLQLCTSVLYDPFLETCKVSSSSLLFPRLLSSLLSSLENPWYMLDQSTSILATVKNIVRSIGCREKVLIDNQYTLLHPGRAWYCLMFNHLQKTTYKNPQTLYRMHGDRRAKQSARALQF